MRRHFGCNHPHRYDKRRLTTHSLHSLRDHSSRARSAACSVHRLNDRITYANNRCCCIASAATMCGVLRCEGPREGRALTVPTIFSMLRRTISTTAGQYRWGGRGGSFCPFCCLRVRGCGGRLWWFCAIPQRCIVCNALWATLPRRVWHEAVVFGRAPLLADVCACGFCGLLACVDVAFGSCAPDHGWHRSCTFRFLLSKLR